MTQPAGQPGQVGAGPRPPQPERSRLTTRAAVLAVVLCAIALSLAYPVREYIGQRRQIDRLEAQRQTYEVQLHRLEAQHGMGVHVREPQRAVVPARGFGKRQADGDRLERHGRYDTEQAIAWSSSPLGGLPG